RSGAITRAACRLARGSARGTIRAAPRLRPRRKRAHRTRARAATARGSLDDPRHQESLPVLLRRLGEHFLARQTGTRLVLAQGRARLSREAEGRNAGHIDGIEARDVLQHMPELRGEPLLL